MNRISWFAVSHDLIDDPKLKIISNKTGITKPAVMAVWLYILREASSSGTRGIIKCLNCEEAAISTEIQEGQIEAVVDLMHERRMIDYESKECSSNGAQYDGVLVCRFQKWQKLSEHEIKRANDRERQRQCRRRKQSGNCQEKLREAEGSAVIPGDLSHEVTVCHKKSPTDIHTDKDSTHTDPPLPAPRRPPPDNLDAAAGDVFAFIVRKRAEKFGSCHYTLKPDRLRHIRARLKEGHTVEELKKAFVYKLEESGAKQYADYVTPFRETNFERYLEQMRLGGGRDAPLHRRMDYLCRPSAYDDEAAERAPAIDKYLATGKIGDEK